MRKPKPTRSTDRGLDSDGRAEPQGDSLVAAIRGMESVLSEVRTVERPGRQFLAGVDKVRRNLDRHFARTEGPDGMLADVDEHRPHLTYRAEKLRQEHSRIGRQLQQLQTSLARCLGESGSPERLDHVRRNANEFLASLRHHQDHGTELVFDAYASDLGVGD